MYVMYSSESLQSSSPNNGSKIGRKRRGKEMAILSKTEGFFEDGKGLSHTSGLLTICRQTGLADNAVNTTTTNNNNNNKHNKHNNNNSTTTITTTTTTNNNNCTRHIVSSLRCVARLGCACLGGREEQTIQTCIESREESDSSCDPGVLGYIRDKELYTTTNKCLQCLIKIMYAVF